MTVISRLSVALVAILWGFNFVVIRWGLDGMDVVTMTALRFLLTAVPIVFFIGKPTIPIYVVALYGMLFGCGLWGLVNLAIAFGTPAGFASLLLQSSAFMSVIVAWVVFKEDVSKTRLLGVASAFVGFMIIAVFRGDAVPLIGAALLFVAAGFWTTCNVIIRLYKPADVVSFIVWSSMFVPLPLMLFWVGEQILADNNIVSTLSELELPSLSGWLSIIFQSYVTTLLGYGVWAHAISRYGLANVAPFSLLVPLSGLMFGWLLYDEVLGTIELAGVTLVISGLVALSLPDRA